MIFISVPINFESVVFSNSTNLAVVILNSSVLKINFVKKPYENLKRDLSPPSKQTERGT